MTFGFSRDDAGKFLNSYYDEKIFENDPFAKLDQEGVGKLMKTAIELGRPVNSSLHVGICGEHGGDPSSVEFCHNIGLDYVSCSPFRVPIARLAAAQAAIAAKNTKAADAKSIVDDETKEKIKEFSDKAQAIAKELADSSAEAAKTGLAALKAGIEAAKKSIEDSKKAN